MSIHLKNAHHAEPVVQNALKLPKKQRNQEFSKLKRKGIFKHNKGEARKVHPSYQREKKGNIWKKIVCCGSCGKMVGSRGLSKHKKNCISNHLNGVTFPITMLEVPVNVDDNFKQHIVNKFLEDEIGSFCRSDEIILTVGNIFYRAVRRKKDKKIQVRKSLRSDMRRFARLYMNMNKSEITQKYGNSRDVFLRCNFQELRQSIDKCTTTDDVLKPGLKQNLLYLIKKFGKALICLALEKDDDEGSEEIQKFLKMLELWEDLIFGDAIYMTNKNREIKLRRPCNLPNEEDIGQIREEVLNCMNNDFPENLFNESNFVKLRDAVCSRLTLLNGRRGGEPSALTISEWNDAQKDSWIDHQRTLELDDLDQLLIKQLKVAYIPGKGNNMYFLMALKNNFKIFVYSFNYNLILKSHQRVFCLF